MLFCSFLFFILGCSNKSHPPPFLNGHRISGLGSENTLPTLEYALQENYLGIEIDIGLTKDLIPVLHHEPWVNVQSCTHSNGSPIKEEKLLKDHDFAALQKEFRCGQTEDISASPIPSLSQLLQELNDHPNMILNLDLKYDPKYTPQPKYFYESVVAVMNQHKRSTFIVTSARKEIIQTFQNHANILTFIEYPNFTSHPHFVRNVWIVLRSKIGLGLGLVKYAKLIKEAKADGISIPYQIASSKDLSEVQQQGYLVQLWTPNSKKQLKRYCKWPVDVLISDFPERAACFSNGTQQEALKRLLSNTKD